jgi:hypothetical protein
LEGLRFNVDEAFKEGDRENPLVREMTDKANSICKAESAAVNAEASGKSLDGDLILHFDQQTGRVLGFKCFENAHGSYSLLLWKVGFERY